MDGHLSESEFLEAGPKAAKIAANILPSNTEKLLLTKSGEGVGATLSLTIIWPPTS